MSAMFAALNAAPTPIAATGFPSRAASFNAVNPPELAPTNSAIRSAFAASAAPTASAAMSYVKRSTIRERPWLGKSGQRIRTPCSAASAAARASQKRPDAGERMQQDPNRLALAHATHVDCIARLSNSALRRAGGHCSRRQHHSARNSHALQQR